MNALASLSLLPLAALLLRPAPLLAAEQDAAIEARFQTSYVNSVLLKDDAIKIESRHGIVTLTGQVDELSHKYLAQEAAAGLPGVEHVENRLEIKLEGTEKSDSWIRAKVRSVLALHRKVSGTGIQVDIRDGVITLRGLANSETQKDLATEFAADVSGVLRVTNVMTVAQARVTPNEKPVSTESVDDASITAQVKLVLLLHHSTSSVRAQVRTVDGVVTISGTAKNAGLILLVTKLASDVTGVKGVINNLTIGPVVSESDGRPSKPRNFRIVSVTH